jgi:hypothetical protein
MGYTHYWRQENGPIPEGAWAEICVDAKALIAAAPCRLAWEVDRPERPPQIDGAVIRFNGAPKPDGCETFLLEREGKGFAGCKTRGQPYDQVVTAVLACAVERAPDHIRVSSDGDDRDWAEPLAWATAVLGRAVALPLRRG